MPDPKSNPAHRIHLALIHPQFQALQIRSRDYLSRYQNFTNTLSFDYDLRTPGNKWTKDSDSNPTKKMFTYTTRIGSTCEDLLLWVAALVRASAAENQAMKCLLCPRLSSDADGQFQNSDDIEAMLKTYGKELVETVEYINKYVRPTYSPVTNNAASIKLTRLLEYQAQLDELLHKTFDILDKFRPDPPSSLVDVWEHIVTIEWSVTTIQRSSNICDFVRKGASGRRFRDLIESAYIRVLEVDDGEWRMTDSDDDE